MAHNTTPRNPFMTNLFSTTLPPFAKGLTLLLMGLAFFVGGANGQTTQSFTSSGSWTCPTGVTSVTVELWGGGGAGASSSTTYNYGGAGGGGNYIRATIPVTAGTTYYFGVGTGATAVAASTTATSSGGITWFNSSNAAPTTQSSVSLQASGGASAKSGTTGAGASGGSAGTYVANNTTGFWIPTGYTTSNTSGGSGSTTAASTAYINLGGAGSVGTSSGAGGDGSAGSAANGTSVSTASVTGATAVTGGGGGGNGATGATASTGGTPGGGGGGTYRNGSRTGGNGGVGQVTLTYTFPTITTFPWTESFTTGTLPAYWVASEGVGGATVHWAETTADATYGVAGPSTTGGTYFAYLYAETANSTYNPYYLTLQNPITVSSGLKFSYQYYLASGNYQGTTGSTGADPYPLELQVSTNSGSTWTSVYSHSTSNTTFATTTATTNWKTNSVDLSTYSGQNIMVRFLGRSNYATAIMDPAVDEINIVLPANYYWNGNGASPLSANWNTGQWSASATTAPSLAWPSTGTNIANFSNSQGGTVTMPTTYNSTPNNVIIGTNGYTFATAANTPSTLSSTLALGSYTLGLSPNPTSAALTLSGVISGSGGITNSTGTTILSGVNGPSLYTGTTTLSSGQITVSNAYALGTGPIAINGGSIDAGSAITPRVTIHKLGVGILLLSALMP